MCSQKYRHELKHRIDLGFFFFVQLSEIVAVDLGVTCKKCSVSPLPVFLHFLSGHKC